MTVDGDWLPPTAHAPRRTRRLLGALIAAAGLALLTGCGSSTSGLQPSPIDSPTPPPVATPTPTALAAVPAPAPTPTPFEQLTLEQRVGQLFVVGTPATAAGASALDAVQNRYVGGVFLAGRSELGVEATRAVVDQLIAASGSAPIPLIVATDQEGGEVQVLRGPGFSEIPSALEQGAQDVDTLTEDAATWGAELAAAGVNFNLAPVTDVLADPATAESNAPIGYFHRQFGYDQATVEQHAGAVIAGMAASGVITSFKHFPGLGLVTDNTDTTANVTDTATDAKSPSVKAAATLIELGAPCVMMSTANYAALDPGVPAAFSPKIVDGLLRETLDFRGCVITDDVSAAAQTQAWSPADRAILSIEAGVDLVLVSASPELAAEMIDAVVAKARTDADFAAKVDTASRRVLFMKTTLLGLSGD
jgi:beta-N-acetylhexosaminidase